MSFICQNTKQEVDKKRTLANNKTPFAPIFQALILLLTVIICLLLQTSFLKYSYVHFIYFYFQTLPQLHGMDQVFYFDK